MDLFLHMVHITSLIPPPFIEMPVPSQESDPSCICISGVGFTSFYDFFLLGFGTVATLWYFLYFSFHYMANNYNDASFWRVSVVKCQLSIVSELSLKKRLT
jgi:hypothetical protein